MCFEPDSAPPVPRLAGAAISHSDVVLTASDANDFAGFLATPDSPNGVGVVILPDVRGLYRYYEELALRFAERDITAVAIDYFGRSAGVGKRDDDFDFMTHSLETTAEDVQLDIAAAVAFLRSDAGGSCRSVFTLGFCFGGRHSWLATAEGYELAGAIGFYGMPSDRDRPPFMESSGRLGPTQRADELKSPILALMAGDDAELGILPEDIEEFDSALARAGVDHEVVTYPGTPHSFFDRLYEEYADESADCWDRVQTFIERYSGVVA